MGVEKELARALASKNRISIDHCFGHIFDLYYKLCVFIAAPYVDTSDEAEDIAQDVFVKFFNSVLENKEFNIQNIKQYLCKASRNRAINLAKHNSVIKNVPFDESVFPSYDLSPSFASEQLRKLWANLSIHEKQLLIDHVFLDRPFKDIADDTCQSINTIKSQYRRLILKLRKELR